MTIDKILERNFPPSSISPIMRVGLKVHCTCGEEYKITKRFLRKQGKRTSLTKSNCPSCKDTSYLIHKVIVYENDNDYFAYIWRK